MRKGRDIKRAKGGRRVNERGDREKEREEEGREEERRKQGKFV